MQRLDRRHLAASLVLAMATAVAGQAPPAAEPGAAATPPTLDPRIDPSKITESEPPPLPEQVILPLPPTHRLPETPEGVAMDRQRWRAGRAAIDRGLTFLRANQDASGGWMVDVAAAPTDEDTPSPVAVAVTALAVKAFLQADAGAVEDPAVQRGVRFVMRARGPDGGFEGGPLSNYVTSAVVSALAAVPTDTFRDTLQDGVAWLETSQWDDGEGLTPRQDWYGGAGYGQRGRPDLSNTQMMLEALYDAGLSPDEPAFQRALAFVTRAQNLKSANPSEWAGTDGGFVYTPAKGGESFASETAGEGRYGEKVPAGQPRSLRSYGSMTYAGFKSLLYAGLSPDDPRVRAAFDWIRRHWTFDENPGLGSQGLYYYLHAMSRALRIAQQDTITDHEGVPHVWRDELVDTLLARQAEDGSWRNDADRWLEAEPVLATVYAVLALEEAMKGE